MPGGPRAMLSIARLVRIIMRKWFCFLAEASNWPLRDGVVILGRAVATAIYASLGNDSTSKHHGRRR